MTSRPTRVGVRTPAYCLRFANPAEATWRLEAQKLEDQHVEASQGVWMGPCMLWAGMAGLGWTLAQPRLGQTGPG